MVPYSSGASGTHTSAAVASAPSSTLPGTEVPAASTTVTSPSSPPATVISSGVEGATSAAPSAGLSVTSAGATCSAEVCCADVPPLSSALQPVSNTSAPAAMAAAVRRISPDPSRLWLTVAVS